MDSVWPTVRRKGMRHSSPTFIALTREALKGNMVLMSRRSTSRSISLQVAFPSSGRMTIEEPSMRPPTHRPRVTPMASLTTLEKPWP